LKPEPTSPSTEENLDEQAQVGDLLARGVLRLPHVDPGYR
jgi:hypothetical protein